MDFFANMISSLDYETERCAEVSLERNPLSLSWMLQQEWQEFIKKMEHLPSGTNMAGWKMDLLNMYSLLNI